MHKEDNVQEDQYPKDNKKVSIEDQLLDQLEQMTNHFHKLPRHEQFAFVTNAELYHHMVLVVNILHSIYNQVQALKEQKHDFP